MIERLAWVAASAARGLDEDEPLALAALRRTGVTVEVVDWDDPDVRWESFDRTVLRSTWDYSERLPEFRRWLHEVRTVTDLRNPLDVVEWNLDKHYLTDLERAGVPTIPTTFAEPGERFEPPEGDYFLKPAVGAGSRGAASYGRDEAGQARAHVARLHERGTSVLVQPLLASVAADGEWPLVYIGGRYSHAASKRVALPEAGTVDQLFAAETVAEHVAGDDQIKVADAAMEVVTHRFGVPVYARVDLVRDDAGRFCVLELELVEPSLFLPLAGPEAPERLAAALIAG